MGEMFFNADHVHMKLDRTICLFKGIPYYIRHDTNDDRVRCASLDGLVKEFYIKYTDKDFDYTHIPLGYCNYGKETYYLVREPQRINQQGLTTRAIRVIGPSPMTLDNIIFNKAFVECVIGLQKDFSDALTLLHEGARGCALSRHMAIRRQSLKLYTIEYRGNTVSISQNRGRTFTPVEHDGVHLIIKRLRQHGVPMA